MTKPIPSYEKAYREICGVLNIAPAKLGTIKEVKDATAVIVPNEVFTWPDIKKLAVKFGKKQPYETYVYDDLYEKYSSEQLSGKVDGDKNYRVVYIPKKYNVEADTVANQLKANPSGHVPSVLEAICFWYALRATGETLDFDSTYIRHFDLPQQRVGSWLLVPDSYVGDVGQPDLGYSVAERDDGGRLAVGENSTLAPSTPGAPLDFVIETVTVNGRTYKLVVE